MKLVEAKAIAENIVISIKPYCERIEIAGSVRRRKPECKDIELVIIPKSSDLFKLQAITDKWKLFKGSITGKYAQFYLPENIKLDLFIANKDNWGNIFLIRTGSADFNRYVIFKKLNEKGYTSRNGIVYPYFNPDEPDIDFSSPVFIREEEDMFNFLGMEFVKPEDRR